MIAKRWMQMNNQIFTVWIFIVHIWPHQLSSYPQSFHVCWQYYAYTQEYNRSLERHGLGVSALVSWFRVKRHSGQEQRRTAVFAGYITNAMMQIWNRQAFRPEGIEIQMYIYSPLQPCSQVWDQEERDPGNSIKCHNVAEAGIYPGNMAHFRLMQNLSPYRYLCRRERDSNENITLSWWLFTHTVVRIQLVL